MAAARARCPGHLGDQPVHLLAHAPVRGVALRRRAQLDHVHRLAGVHLHDEADAVGHGNRVLGCVLEPGLAQAARTGRRRGVITPSPVGERAGVLDLGGRGVAVVGR